MNKDFGVLYFSDTVVFYQRPEEWRGWAFADVHAIAVRAWTGLAAAGIPTRGAISFGDFHVQQDSSRRHSVFFGEALIDAYKTAELSQENSNWIGLTLCPSGWQAVEYMDPGLISETAAENLWVLV